MSVLVGAGAAAFVKHLADQSVKVTHACQLRDLDSYLEIGGIPCRDRLQALGARRFTPFDTDSLDKALGLWDKVFFNGGDIGEPFARGRLMTPTVYGPISLQFRPAVLLAAADISVVRNTAARPGFDRSRDSLPLSEVMRSQVTLQTEMNCRAPLGALPFDYLDQVLVDPVSLNGDSLLERVQALFAGIAMTQIKVFPRYMYSKARLSFFAELVEWARTAAAGSQDVRIPSSIDTFMFDLGPAKAFTLRRWAKYLAIGTLSYEGRGS